MSVRKKGVAEDVRLRPFASETFNAQSFVQSILLSQRQSEEVLPEIETFIQSVNEEISVFIRKNKRDLMRGTEDISLLAAKYTALHQTSQSLLQRASKLRLESTASLQALRAKAEELQRMHSTGVVLRQLRQFVHIKGQLDYQIKLCSLSSSNPEQQLLNTSEVDIRQLASLARVLHELELLVSLPTLSLVETVVEARPDIESFGAQLRKSAQNILLLSLQEQNQANLSSALQVDILQFLKFLLPNQHYSNMFTVTLHTVGILSSRVASRGAQQCSK